MIYELMESVYEASEEGGPRNSMINLLNWDLPIMLLWHPMDIIHNS